jgi:PAS domain S-box-containing protein
MGAATVETRWKRKGGQIIDVLLSTTVLDRADFSKGVTFTALDITERRRAENALRESEEKFRSLAEQSPNMIFINKKGRIVYANKKCEEVMGYTREEFYSPDFDFMTMMAPESVDLTRENFARHMRGEEVEPYDYCLVNKTGERIEAINSSKLITYEGEPAILGIVTDITEHKKAEEELRQYDHIVSSSTDMMALLDKRFTYVAANASYLETFKKTRGEVIGRTAPEVFGKEFFETVIKPKAERCLAGEEVNYQAWFDFPASEPRYMDINYYPYTGINNY